MPIRTSSVPIQALYVGDVLAEKAYLGDIQVWPLDTEPPDTSAYDAAVLADGPLAFYKLDETSGTVMTDSSGNGRDGSYVNSPVLGQYSVIPGGTGRSARFDGFAEEMKGVTSYASWMNTPAMTIMTTCFAATPNLRILASRYTDSGNDWSWFLYTDDRKVKFFYRSAGGTNYSIDSGVALAEGVRYYICAYVGASGAGLRVYDSTGLVGSATGTGATLNSSSRNLVIADCDPPVQYSYAGYLDGLALFGSALATSRIDELAGYALAPSEPWAHRASGILPRNGTTTQTISFTPASAGSLLVAVVASSLTHTAVTPGWTKRLSPYSRAELAVFTRYASAGDSSLQLTLSGSNSPLLYTVYEFPPGCSWHSGASAQSNITPVTLSGLPGSNVAVFAAGATYRTPASPMDESRSLRYFWTNDTTLDEPYSGTDGAFLNIGYFTHFPDTTASLLVPGDQRSGTLALYETVMFAIGTP